MNTSADRLKEFPSLFFSFPDVKRLSTMVLDVSSFL